MSLRSTRATVDYLERHGRLIRLAEPIDARLEAAEIQRRLFRSGGPAVLFENVRDGRFPMVSNLFGSWENIELLFGRRIETLKKLFQLRGRPDQWLRHPFKLLGSVRTAWQMLPRRVRGGPVLACQTQIDQLPQLVSWPDDGGPYITLPQVYSEDPDRGGLLRSNLGMYRVQMAGGDYEPNREVGMHYQIHRGIAVHHAAALRRGEPLRVNVFVGGSPAMSVAAVMPLPENISELLVAGPLAGHRIPMITRPADRLPIYADADFCIAGRLDASRLAEEGPFGDHLGYYSLRHVFPVLRVEAVYHRPDAVWPFTVVGRPPQEDSILGRLIHELTGPVIPDVVPGVEEVHAVDAAGVHPLLLAIGSERYVPYEADRRPRELLTQANALLGQGQMSLAKYLLIAARRDAPDLHTTDVAAFWQHVLRRVDWRRDLHFQTETTIDTLDYSGDGLNRGSKLVVAAVGPPRRELPDRLEESPALPDGFEQPRVAIPGVLVVQRRPGGDVSSGQSAERFCRFFTAEAPINRFPLIVLVDDAELTARNLENFLWVTFTRSNPAADVYGIESFFDRKHWGCRGSLVIDACTKPHHAPPLIEDPQVTARIDALAARGGMLGRYL